LVCLKLGHSHVMKKWWSIKLHQIYQKFSNHFQTKPTFPFLSKGFFSLRAAISVRSERPHPHLHCGQHPEFLFGDVSEHRHLMGWPRWPR
jgi:hypothetical protein